jgi:anti-anti-sigma regulatory factor
LTFRIQPAERSTHVVFAVSGALNTEAIAELQALLDAESGDRVVLDLRDVTFASRDAVVFLARREALGIWLVNCPTYLRDWITKERDPL